MSNKLTDITISKARDGLEKGEFSAVELTKAHIEAMEKTKYMNAFITETPELALKQAEKSDKRIKEDTSSHGREEDSCGSGAPPRRGTSDNNSESEPLREGKDTRCTGKHEGYKDLPRRSGYGRGRSRQNRQN